MRRANDARQVARKQVLTVEERLDGPSAGPVQVPNSLGSAQDCSRGAQWPCCQWCADCLSWKGWRGALGDMAWQVIQGCALVPQVKLQQLVWLLLHQTCAASCLASNWT